MKICNDILELTLDAAGSIVEILDKRIARRYITQNEFSGLFRIIAPDGDWQGRHADSCVQDHVEIEKIAKDKAVIRYEALIFSPRKVGFDFNISNPGKSIGIVEKQSEQPITCEVMIAIEDDEIQLKICVFNQSGPKVGDVIFPIVSGLGEETANMDLFWPVQTQIQSRHIEKPYINLGADNHKEWFHEKRFVQARYPLELTTAWVDLSDGLGGISFEYRSEKPQIFDFYMEKVVDKKVYENGQLQKALFFGSQFYPDIKAGGQWESPLCILHVHNNDWHTVAQRHRTWLRGVMDPPQTPDSFLQSIGWHFFLMRLQDGSDVRDYGDLPAMAAAARDAGIENIMLFGLYDKGHDNDYDMSYLPNEEWGGQKKLVEMVRRVQAAGTRVIPFFNGTLMDSRLLEKNPELLQICVKGRTGSRYGGQDWSRPVFDFPQCSYKGYTMARNNMLYEVCITSEKGAEWFADTVRRLSQEYEMGNIQLDQLAHKCYVCYDDSHGHDSPHDAYTEDLVHLLKRVRSELREYNPEGVMIGEGFSDLTAGYCDAFWNWNQMDNPQIVRYSVPWMHFSCEIDAMDYGRANFCFANGVLFDLKIDGGVGILSDYPAFQKHLKKLSDLKVMLKDSYALGEFEDEYGIEYTADEGICAKVYVNKAAGCAAVIVANVTEKNVCCDIAVQLKGEMDRLNFDGERNTIEGNRCHMSLGAYEVNALVIQLRDKEWTVC